MSNQHNPCNGEEKKYPPAAEPEELSGEEFSLESILAEFGQGAAEPVQNGEETAAPEEQPPHAPDVPEEQPAEPEEPEEKPVAEKPLPKRKKVLRFPGKFRPEK